MVTKLYLGVDGGQSGTTAVIGDEAGRVIGVGRSGPSNHGGEVDALEKFKHALAECVRAAAENAGIEGAVRFESACMGFSGGAEDKDAIARGVVKAEKYTITHDALIALLGATGGEPGVVVIAGTGSIAFGRNAEGRTARAGGWGYVFGDEGGAFDLVRQALRAVLRFEEGWGPGTALREVLLSETGARDANELVHRFYTDEYPRARIAALAKAVDGVAMVGDAVAREILNGAAQSLASIASAVRGQLFEAGEGAVISYVGGAFGCLILLERFRMLVELQDGNLVAAPRHGPAEGALIEAYRVVGLNPRHDGRG